MDLQGSDPDTFTQQVYCIKKEVYSDCVYGSTNESQISSVSEDCKSVYSFSFLDESSTEPVLEPSSNICSFQTETDDSFGKTSVSLINQDTQIGESVICVVQEKLINIRGNDVLRNSQHTDGRGRGSELVEELSGTEYKPECTGYEDKLGSTEGKSRITDCGEDKPRHTERAEDRPRHTDHTEDRTRHTDRAEDRPRNTDHAEDRPRNTDRAEDRTRHTNHAEDRPRHTNRAEDRIRHTNHAEDRPRHTNRAEDRTRHTNRAEDRPRHTNRAEDRTRHTNRAEDRPNRTYHCKNEPLQTHSTPSHWRKATHGFVYEQSRSLQRSNFSFMESQTRISTAWQSVPPDRSDAMREHVPKNTSQPMSHMAQSTTSYTCHNGPQLMPSRYNYQNILHGAAQDLYQGIPPHWAEQDLSQNIPPHWAEQVDQSVPQATYYPRQGPKKRHHPLEDSLSSPPKFARSRAELTMLRPQDYISGDSSSHSRPLTLYQNEPSQYPYHDSLPPFFSEKAQPIWQAPHSFYNHSASPYSSVHPLLDSHNSLCPPQMNSWSRYYYKPLSACHGDRQSTRSDNFRHERNTPYTQETARQTHKWHSRFREEFRTRDSNKGPRNHHERKPAFRTKDNKTGGCQSVKEKQAPEEKLIGPITKGGLKEKLLQLQKHVKKSKYSRDQPIMVFNMAFYESKCGLNHCFHLEQVPNEQGIHMYTRTRVLVEGRTVAQAVANGRKESKTRAFHRAVSLLTGTDIDTIFEEHFENEKVYELSDDITELIKKEVDKQKALKKPAVTRLDEESLDTLIKDLQLPAKEGVTAVMTIDKNCVQMKIKLMAIYKIVRPPGQLISITCDLYILDRLLARGRAGTRRQAQADAYAKAGDILKKSTPTDVLTGFPRFSEEELNKCDIMEVVYKGYTKVCESNRCRLNRLKQLPAEQRSISHLIIIEHKDWAEDRKKHSHCILNQSATQCGCLLEWTTQPEDVCFRCSMKLQGKEISSVLAKQRKTALSMASSVALFNLYETQPVVQGFQLDFPKIWISRDDLLKRSQAHPKDCQATLDKQVEDTNISGAIAEMLDQFFSRPTLEYFVGAPDWKPEEKKQLLVLAVARGLKVVTDVFCEERLVIISQKFDLSEMVAILENQPNKSQGRYRLLPPEEKPSYSDIAGEVAANESIVKEYQASTRVHDQHKSLFDDENGDDEEKNIDDEDKNIDDENINSGMEGADLYLDSEDFDDFVTADSSFFGAAEVKEGVGLETTQPLEMPLPKRASTPLRAAADIACVDELRIPELTSQPTLVESNRAIPAASMPLAALESTQIKLQSPGPLMPLAAVESTQIKLQSPGPLMPLAAVESTQIKLQSPGPMCDIVHQSASLGVRLYMSPLSPVQQQNTTPVVQSQSKTIRDHSTIDFEGISCSRTDTHPQVMAKPQPWKNELKRSIDLEAGTTSTGYLYEGELEQVWCQRQLLVQQQWVEQELPQKFQQMSQV